MAVPVLVFPQLFTTVTSHLYVLPGTGVNVTVLVEAGVETSLITDPSDVSVIFTSYTVAPATSFHEQLAALVHTGRVSEICCWGLCVRSMA